jgi:hypothetical protein
MLAKYNRLFGIRHHGSLKIFSGIAPGEIIGHKSRWSELTRPLHSHMV